jgi:cytochrome c peroxidase
VITILAITIIAISPVVQSGSEEIILAAHCPPGFELTDDNTCECRNLYQQYESLRGSGVGGLKSALPDIRDGFSPQQIDLGRYLFFDPVLSGNGSLACSSCHDPDYGFSDGKGRSVGMDGEILKRGAPSLWNVGFLRSLFWDARASTLEEQMQGPLYSEVEMGTSPEKLAATLNKIPTYRRLFAEAFPSTRDGIRVQDVHTAIAAFESSLISLNSRYDHYAHGYAGALTENEIEGLNIFRSFVARCAECHTPPLFTNQQVAVLGTPEPDGLPLDRGAQKTYADPKFRAGFKVPGLRNVARTAPYMHSGTFETLEETVAFYTGGRGHAVPEGEDLLLHWHIWEPDLSDRELDRLVDFLGTLTDEAFMPQVPKILPSGLKPGSARNENG